MMSRLIFVVLLASVVACRRDSAPAPPPVTHPELLAMAAQDAPWEPALFVRAATILKELASGGPDALPHRQTPFFQRMVAPAQLADAGGPPATTEAKVRRLMVIHEPLLDVFSVYNKSGLDALSGDSRTARFIETFELTAVILEHHCELVESTRPILAGLAPDAPDRATLTEAIDGLQQSLRLMLVGVTIMLSEPSSARARDLAPIADRLAAALARFRALTPPAITDEALAALRSAADGQDDPQRKQLLRTIAGPVERP